MKTLCAVLLVSAIAWLMAPAVSLAQTTYDYKTGNHYSKRGSTYQGQNFNTGSSWGTYGSTRGTTRGYDSKGNQWQYDRSSGYYHNYGTGEIRYKGEKLSW